MPCTVLTTCKKEVTLEALTARLGAKVSLLADCWTAAVLRTAASATAANGDGGGIQSGILWYMVVLLLLLVLSCCCL